MGQPPAPNAPLVLASASSQVSVGPGQADFAVGFYGEHLTSLEGAIEYLRRKLGTIVSALNGVDVHVLVAGVVLTLQFSFPTDGAEGVLRHLLETHIREEIPVVDVADARALVESRLDSLSELPAGWLDGEGAAPSATALVTARDVIRILLTLNVPRPRLAPTPEGGVEAEWSVGDREVSVIFDRGGALHGNSVDVTTGEMSEPELNPADYQAVAEFVLGPGR